MDNSHIIQQKGPIAVKKFCASVRPCALRERELVEPGSVNPGSRKVTPGRRTIVFFHVHTANAPLHIIHRLHFKPGCENGGRFVMEAGRVTVRRTKPISLGPPLTGDRWVAGNILTNFSDHRRSVIPLEGAAKVAQRYAIDWFNVDQGGRPFREDPHQNSNWSGFGKPVIAVADSIVVEAVDVAPDNVFFQVPLNPANMLGNYVSLSLGNAYFAIYAHLQKGSLLVKPGQRVKRGDIIGKLGNSGN